MSSAKSRLREIRFSAISLIYILNNRGTSNDLWGPPAETLQSEEDELFINTLLSILQVTREPIQ